MGEFGVCMRGGELGWDIKVGVLLLERERRNGTRNMR
jgi:hypothetical protein